ncbi:MAG: cation transporter [Candidatus Methylomirabilia bacterium]
MGLFDKDDGEKAVVHIEGMSCGHCVMRVEKGVAALPGVKSAKVDLGKKEGTFAFDPKLVSADAIKAKINEIGYKA